MPGGDEYASVGGGSLKLKAVKGAKVDKHKKRKHKKAAEDGSKDYSSNDTAYPRRSNDTAATNPSESDLVSGQPGESTINADPPEPPQSTKTAAELRHEERRRKLLEERLQREGVKTHKERVEELNKYLSGLSEHNDMPKIGPG